MQRFSSADWALAALVLGGGVAFGAEVLEHQLGMAPCPLCLMQRLWVFLVALIVYVGLAHNPRWGIYPLLAIIAALIGSGFAIRHLWLQGLPADQLPDCTAPMTYLFESRQWGEAWAAMFSGTGDCGSSTDAVLGVPLPAWALLAFIALIVLSALQWRTRH